jgi:putative ABC transport system ATP-binding protein
MATDSRRDGTEEDAVVLLADVHKVYRVGERIPALSDVSFTLPRGSYTAVMGPSGSGKSTLLNVIGCLDTPTTGTVLVDGEDITALSDDGRARVRGEKIGFVFQTFNLMPRLTAEENVALPLVFRGRSRTERVRRARELLDRVGLGDRVEHKPNELSGGQRQRVAIARALVNEPAIILADEPTGSLDSETSRQIMGLFQQLHEAGNTILLVTHERDIAEHAQQVVHMLDGRIEHVESVDERRTIELSEEGPWTS